MKFKPKNGNKFKVNPFQKGALITIPAIIQLQDDLKNNYNEPLLLTEWVTQDLLERKFSEIRGLGGGFCLHPTPLQYEQRLGQSIKITLLKEPKFDLLARKEKIQIKHGTEPLIPSENSETAILDYEKMQLDGMESFAERVINKVQSIQDLKPYKATFYLHIVEMYSLFNGAHPDNGMSKGYHIDTSTKIESKFSN